MSSIPWYNLAMEITCQFYCPPMRIDRVGPNLRRTAAEPMTFSTSDGTTIDGVTIPPTDVTPVPVPWWQVWRLPSKYLHWVVAPCEAEKSDDAPNLLNDLYVSVQLPEEPVEVQPLKMRAVAAEMRGCSVVFLRGGERWEGEVTFPECVVPMGSPAESVTAYGRLRKVN